MSNLTRQKILEKLENFNEYLDYLNQLKKEIKNEKSFISETPRIVILSPEASGEGFLSDSSVEVCRPEWSEGSLDSSSRCFGIQNDNMIRMTTEFICIS